MMGFMIVFAVLFTVVFLFIDLMIFDFEMTITVYRVARELFFRYELYQIDQVEVTEGKDRMDYRLIIKKGRIRLPVESSRKVAENLKRIREVNVDKDLTVTIKAKIDTKNLRVLRVKEYIVR